MSHMVQAYGFTPECTEQDTKSYALKNIKFYLNYSEEHGKYKTTDHGHSEHIQTLYSELIPLSTALIPKKTEAIMMLLAQPRWICGSSKPRSHQKMYSSLGNLSSFVRFYGEHYYEVLPETLKGVYGLVPKSNLLCFWSLLNLKVILNPS